MNFTEFKKIFPQAKRLPSPASYRVKLADGDVYLAKKDLTKREQILCKLLKDKPLIPSKLSDWQLYLNGQAMQPKVGSQVRFLYFQVKDLKKENRKQWRAQLLSFFGTQTPCFWQDEENIVVIDDRCHLSAEELTGILTTMDSDFLTKTHLLVGLVWSRQSDLAALFNEEKKINNFISWHSKVVTVPQAALTFYTQFNKQKSSVMRTYQDYFKDKEDIKELVTNLYQVGGNVSQAAKNMFVHRNTLEYRIEKILQNYYLNLHQMDDLVFCYLLFV